MRRFGAGLLLALSFLAYATNCLSMPDPGEPAPAFVLRELNDAATVVSSEGLFAGKTTLISFFATWCKPCKQEIPILRALSERNKHKGFQVVLISLDQLGMKEVNVFLKEAGAGDLLVLWDDEGEAMSSYGVMNLPTNVLVGPDGKVRLAWLGDLPERIEELRVHLEGLPAPAGKQLGGVPETPKPARK